MFSKTLALATLASTALAQVGVTAPPQFGDKFGVTVTGNGINKELTASDGRIFVGGSQSPNCTDGQRQDFATFILYSDGGLYLYTNSNPVQQLWVDASGMGQGISGYTTGDESTVKNAGRTRFEVGTDGELTFNGVKGKACPTQEADKWTVWWSTSAKPGFQECVDVSLKAYSAPARIACEYTPNTSI